MLADIRPDIPVAEELALWALRSKFTPSTSSIATRLKRLSPAQVSFDAIVANAAYVVWNDLGRRRLGRDVPPHHRRQPARNHPPRARGLAGDDDARTRQDRHRDSRSPARSAACAAGPHYVAAKGGLNAFIKWAARKARRTASMSTASRPARRESPMTARTSIRPLRHSARPARPARGHGGTDRVSLLGGVGLHLRLGARRQRRHFHELIRQEQGMRIEGVAVVTGGGSGIGEACCRELAERGARSSCSTAIWSGGGGGARDRRRSRSRPTSPTTDR